MSREKKYRIAYDCAAMKVGCVLIQAAMGGTVPRALFNKFFGDSSSWTLRAYDCSVYEVTEAQLPALAHNTDFTRKEF